MSSRDAILERLRAARRPFEMVPPVMDPRPMVPLADMSPGALVAQFTREAEALGCGVMRCASPDEAIARILDRIAPDTAIQSWEMAQIPLSGLGEALTVAGIRITPGDSAVRVGLTGVDAALAGTGSLVLAAGPGKPRAASLLPPLHIAVVTVDQIIPGFEAWAAGQAADAFQGFRRASGVVVISGPSRTGDIASILVRGVHGPREVQIILVDMAD